ncbi:MAG TPA: GNAT family N-acetyltransferase [Symbiobacteriaceae bacterium]|nr:GNAT family N-acetyltransferase [Symbiobacteriaceae bacterium]
MYQIRSLSLPNDYARLADLYNARRLEPLTVADLQDGDSKIPTPGPVRCDDQGRLVSHCRDRFVADDETGLMVGYADAWRAPWTPPGEIVISFVIDPAHAGRGLEQLLLDRAEATAVTKGAAVIKAQVPEADAETVTQRGYAIERHLFESSLDLASFDESRFPAAPEGIRFFTLADQPGEATERQIYEVERVTHPDNPGTGGAELTFPFDHWRMWVLQSERALPDCFILAAAEDGQVVGTTYMHRLENGAMHTLFTGVIPAYRGRGIALALKLQALATARRHGAPYMRTDNDSQNGPMLAVNWKMGYKPLPGEYITVKKLK